MDELLAKILYIVTTFTSVGEESYAVREICDAFETTFGTLIDPCGRAHKTSCGSDSCEERCELKRNHTGDHTYVRTWK